MDLSEKIEKYTEYFKHQNYNDVLDFKSVTSELFNHFDWENESDCKKIEGLYEESLFYGEIFDQAVAKAVELKDQAEDDDLENLVFLLEDDDDNIDSVKKLKA